MDICLISFIIFSLNFEDTELGFSQWKPAVFSLQITEEVDLNLYLFMKQDTAISMCKNLFFKEKSIEKI